MVSEIRIKQSTLRRNSVPSSNKNKLSRKDTGAENQLIRKYTDAENVITIQDLCSSKMKEIVISQKEKVQLVEYGSSAYNELVDLRYEILRKPLNLQFTADQLAAESDYYHLAYYLDEKLIATLILVPESGGKMKMKQVAVDASHQSKGYGAKLVFAAEQLAVAYGYNNIYCHARDKAVPFYLKLNYNQVGEMFEEVTIPHWEMEKDLY